MFYRSFYDYFNSAYNALEQRIAVRRRETARSILVVMCRSLDSYLAREIVRDAVSAYSLPAYRK